MSCGQREKQRLGGSVAMIGLVAAWVAAIICAIKVFNLVANAAGGGAVMDLLAIVAAVIVLLVAGVVLGWVNGVMFRMASGVLRALNELGNSPGFYQSMATMECTLFVLKSQPPPTPESENW